MAEAAELDIDSMVDTLAQDIGGESYVPETESAEPTEDISGVDAAIEAQPESTETIDQSATDPVVDNDDLPAPQSWKKEMRPIWDKLAKGEPLSKEEARATAKYYNEREQQMLNGLTGYKSDAEYGRSLRQVVSQYEDILQAQGLDAPKAINYLFNAHKQLSSGNEQQKMAYLQQVARSYGINLQAAQQQQADPAVAALSQHLTPLEQRLQQMEAAMTAAQQQQYEQRKAEASQTVEKFASDPAHPYFDDVADDIVALLKTGLPLPDAYEKAVWANPVTRQKELDRLQSARETEAKAKARAAAEAAKKAASTNVRSRDTGRTHTEPQATMDNLDGVLRETLADIRARV